MHLWPYLLEIPSSPKVVVKPIMGNVFGTSEDREDGPTDPCVYPACGHCRDLTDLEHPPTPPEEEDQTTANNNNNNNNAGNKGNGKGQNNQNNGKGKNQQNKKGNNKNANRKGSNNNSNFNCNQGNSGGCEVGEVVEVQTDGQCAGDNGDESDDNSGPGKYPRVFFRIFSQPQIVLPF